MSRKAVLAATVLMLLAALTGCGDDDGSVFEGSTTSAVETTTTAAATTSSEAATSTTLGPTSTTGGGVGNALGGMVSDALSEGAATPGSAVTGDEEQCLTAGFSQAIGADRFAELDAMAAGAEDMSEVFGQMTDPELDAMVAAISDCIDVEALLLAEMAGEDLSPEMAACVAGEVSQEDTLNTLVRAMISGEDPATNPDFIAVVMPIMTEACVGPMEDMLIDEFVAGGISESSATCLAGEFLQGGLFESLLNTMMSGTDFPTDPELQAQMMAAFTSCLTPEELQNLGG